MPHRAHDAEHRLSGWARLVAASAALLAFAAGTLIVWGVVTSQKRVAAYSVRGALDAIELDLGDADVEVVGAGGGATVQVRRTDAFAYGQSAQTSRGVQDGILRIRSRCPATVMGSCSAGYRLRVPDNVPLVVRTGGGSVRLDGYRGSATINTSTGDVDVAGWCGFKLQVRAGRGNVQAATACAPERLDLRTRVGDVRAQVPRGRYRVDADTDSGRRKVTGLTLAEDAAFQIQALSGTGNVDVEAIR
jgi:hypothetical protein